MSPWSCVKGIGRWSCPSISASCSSFLKKGNLLLLKAIMSQTEKEVSEMLKSLRKIKVNSQQGINTDVHCKYVQFILHELGELIINFQSAQPWLHYYCIHSVKLLGLDLSVEDKQLMKKALSYCFSQGFGGGFMQLPHLAPTYAAFLAIIELGPEAYDLLDRPKIYQFFKKCKKGGKFMMHEEGQCDLRAIFIVTLITVTLNLPRDILEGVAETILLSQSHEGGISNVIGGEAHGGFTFCGIAALALLKRLEDLDVSRLMLWLSQRQTEFGGFNGRTNKLIDSCYSHWVGSVFNIVNNYFNGKVNYENHLLYLEEDLQRYILFYCQDLKKGGLWDKPGKNRDIYHTCYALSGLSASQDLVGCLNDVFIEDIEPIFNVTLPAYKEAMAYFSKLEPLIL